MTEDQIKYMAARFLAWKLPKDFHPDNGISFDPAVPHPACPPVGTNLFSADQAEVMVRFMVEGLPDVLPPEEACSDARLRELWKECGGFVHTGSLDPSIPDVLRKIIAAVTRAAAGLPKLS